jgi:putative peptidoglycan lipid II flippase
VLFLVALVPAAAVGVGLDAVLGAFSDGFAVSSVPTAVVSLAVVGITMTVIYVAVLALLRSADLRALTEPVLRRIRRNG